MPLPTCWSLGTEMPAMAARGSGRRSERVGRLTTMATQAAAKPRMPSSQPMTACQPGVSGTGGRSTLPAWLAADARARTFTTLSAPVGTTMSRPTPNRPATIATNATAGRRRRWAPSASAMPSRPAAPP